MCVCVCVRVVAHACGYVQVCVRVSTHWINCVLCLVYGVAQYFDAQYFDVSYAHNIDVDTPPLCPSHHNSGVDTDDAKILIQRAHAR